MARCDLNGDIDRCAIANDTSEREKSTVLLKYTFLWAAKQKWSLNKYK